MNSTSTRHDHADDRPSTSRPTAPACPSAADPRSSSSPTATTFDLRIAPVAKRLGDATGADARLQRLDPRPDAAGARGLGVVVNVVNDGDLEATVHWHGLRLENRYDGTHETQAPIPVGGSFTYRIAFPDPGVYWYHPHIREDYGQEMGLYGNILVDPADPDYWPPAHRELAADPRRRPDRGRQDRAVQPRPRRRYAAMGRFGNVLLVGGETDLALTAQRGRGRALLPHQHRQHARLQRRAARRADEARRRRQRPRRARGVRRRRSSSRRPSGSSSTCSSTQPGELTLEHRTPGPDLPARHDRRRRRAGRRRRSRDAVRRRCARTRRWSPSGSGSRRTSTRAPDKTLAFVAEMDMGVPGRGRSSTPARCTRRSSATSPAAARSAA